MNWASEILGRSYLLAHAYLLAASAIPQEGTKSWLSVFLSGTVNLGSRKVVLLSTLGCLPGLILSMNILDHGVHVIIN